jgi:hypothetical protein
MVGESNRLLAQIQYEPENGWAPCLLDCGDPDCREWNTLWTEADPQHEERRWILTHISECEMSDPD